VVYGALTAFLNDGKCADMRSHEMISCALQFHYERQGHVIPDVLRQDVEYLMDFAVRRASEQEQK